MQSVGLAIFSADFYQKEGKEDEGFTFNFFTSEYEANRYTEMIITDKSLKTGSFIVDGLPDYSDPTDCMRTEHSHLKPSECKGAIKLGNLAN